MSRESPATQQRTALEPAAQNSTPITLDLQQQGVQLLFIPCFATVHKECVQKVKTQPAHSPNDNTQAAQPSPIINKTQPSQLHIHNVTIKVAQVNNYPEAPNPAVERDSLGCTPQIKSTTLPASRTIEDKPRGVEYVSTTPSLNPATKEKRHNGPGGKIKNSQLSKVQNNAGQGRPQVGTPTNHALALNARDGRENSKTTSVPVAQTQDQGHQKGSNRKDPPTTETITELFKPNHNHRENSQTRGNVVTATHDSPVSASDRSRPRGSEGNHTVKQPREQARQRPARPHYGHAPTELKSCTAPNQADLQSQRGRDPTQKRHETYESPRQYSAVGTSIDDRTITGSGYPKVLEKEDITQELVDLNSRLGRKKKEGWSDCVRMILIGKASAEIMGLKIKEGVYHIDVVLDIQAPKDQLKHIRECMDESPVFREFDALGHKAEKKKCKTFFGTATQRAAVFDQVSRNGNCVSGSLKHLRAYVMDKEHALSFELRRWAALGNDEHAQSSSMSIANALRRELILKAPIRKEQPQSGPHKD